MLRTFRGPASLDSVRVALDEQRLARDAGLLLSARRQIVSDRGAGERRCGSGTGCDPERTRERLVTKLERLGYTVTLQEEVGSLQVAARPLGGATGCSTTTT
jgi:hypothetical protein